MAKLLVTITGHYVRGPEGRVYATDQVTDHRFFSRYLEVFDQVCVAARVGIKSTIPPDLPRADGPGVTFCDLPDFVGPWQYLRCRRQLVAKLREMTEAYQSFCLRVPCPIGTLAWQELRRRGHPFGVEVMADPWDSLSPGSVRSVVRPLARRLTARALRLQCSTARAAAYVTRAALQRSYPPAEDAFTTNYSSIELPEHHLATQPRSNFRGAYRLVFVGTFAVLYKAPDVLIRALAKVARSDLHLTLVGEGRERPQLEKLATECGISGQTTFLGRLPAGEAIRDVLDASDLFVLPSRQEGVPRAMIEAMARGLPCIGSTVGGIPELLDARWMVPPNDADGLAALIGRAVDDPDALASAARHNLEVAREYVSETLQARRIEFYRAIHSASMA